MFIEPSVSVGSASSVRSGMDLGPCVGGVARCGIMPLLTELSRGPGAAFTINMALLRSLALAQPCKRNQPVKVWVNRLQGQD